MIRFIADSGCDIFTLGNESFATVPLHISTDEKSYTDDKNLDTHELLTYLKKYKGRSYTSCPGISDWMKAFVNEDGSIPDEIYVVTLTSALSGTYNSACMAKDQFLEEHPGVNIHVVDSLSVGPEMRILLEKLVELKKQGLSFTETVEAIEAYKKHTRLFFSFISIHNLVANGRVSRFAATAQSALKLSIIGTASSEGTIESRGKARGEAKVINTLLEEMEAAGCKKGRIRITHVENRELAVHVKEAIAEKFDCTDFEIYPVRGLCSYYCEKGGICISCECN